MVKSVCLFLSKKGHRKTFAKNKLLGRALGMRWPGPCSEASPSRGAGMSAAAGQQPQPWGAPWHFYPLPTKGSPPSLGFRCVFLFFKNRPGSGEDFLHLPNVFLPWAGQCPVLASPSSSDLFLDPSTLLMAPSRLAFAHVAFLAWNVLFSYLPRLTPRLPFMTQLNYQPWGRSSLAFKLWGNSCEFPLGPAHTSIPALIAFYWNGIFTRLSSLLDHMPLSIGVVSDLLLNSDTRHNSQ